MVERRERRKFGRMRIVPGIEKARESRKETLIFAVVAIRKIGNLDLDGS